MNNSTLTLGNSPQRFEVTSNCRSYGEYLASQCSVIIASFYNPLTATGGIGTVMKTISSKFKRLEVVYVEPSNKSSTSHESFTHKVHPINISEITINDFHRKICKGYVWPILHEEEADYPPKKVIGSIDEFSHQYVEHLLEIIGKCSSEPILWFNDYAMIPVLRAFYRRNNQVSQIGISIRSSFGITHVPKFASPIHEIIQEGLLSANFVSFHRRRDVYHFLEFVDKSSSAEVSWEDLRVRVGNHLVIPRTVAMGSSPEYWSLAGKSQEAEEQFKLIKERFPEEDIVLSVSRLEPHKAIEFELDVIEKLIKYYPCLQSKFRFLRIMPVFKEYKELKTYYSLKERIEEKILSINKPFKNLSWKPIELISGSSLQHNKLAGYYRASSVLMVLSHADGFNHVSVESVLSKQVGDPPLTLVLSDTGSSDYLNEKFIRANSKSATEVALSLAQVLTDKSERRHNLYAAYLEVAAARTSLDWAYEVLGGIASSTRA